MELRAYRLPIGAAREEGRQPSHDGEYLTIYSRPGSREWIAGDNAGVAATSWQSFADQVPGDAESIGLDAEIEASIGEGEPVDSEEINSSAVRHMLMGFRWEAHQ